MNCIDLMSKLSKMLRYVAKHSKHRKSTKLIKLQWIASIWCENDQKRWGTSQNIQNNANYKNNQITMDCIDLMSKQSKMLSYVAKLQMWSYYDEFASIWRQNDLKCWDRSQNYKCDHITMNLHRFDVKTITTTQNYESDQIIMHCIDLTSKRSRMLRYVAKHSKQRKTTNEIKLQWICIDLTSKRSKMLSYVAKLQMWSYFDEFQSIWRQNYQNIWVRSQNYKSNQITMDCIDLTSKRLKLLSYVPKLQRNRITINCIDLMPKRSRMLSYVAKHSKQRKTTKVIKLQWIASIWRQNDHNNAKLRKWSNYNALHRFDVKTIKTFELRP